MTPRRAGTTASTGVRRALENQANINTSRRRSGVMLSTLSAAERRRALAKDGSDLPPSQVISVGETYDFAVASAPEASWGAVSENGRLRQGTGGPPGRRPPRAHVLMLTTL